MPNQFNRRDFLRNLACTGSGLIILANSKSVRGVPANERLNIRIHSCLKISTLCFINPLGTGLERPSLPGPNGPPIATNPPATALDRRPPFA